MPDDDILHAYLATSWRIRLASGTLVLRIAEPSPLANFGIVTAFNPGSSPRPPDVNRAANRRLLDRLLGAGAYVRPAVALGHGPEAGMWRERGFAATGPKLETLVRLGREFGQNAIVWVTESGAPRLVVTRDGFAGRSSGTMI